MEQRQNKCAFTLIELLVVMAIIALLSSMLFVMIGESDDKNNELETRLLISRITAGCEQFENLTGDIPLPTGDRTNVESGSWYPTTNTGGWEKQQLWWRLSTEMTDAARKTADDYALQKDVEANPYQSKTYQKRIHPAWNDGQINTEKNAILDAAVSDADADYHLGISTDTGYRMGIKEKIVNMRGALARDMGMRIHQTMPILKVADIGSQYLSNDTIIDLWGNPLIYIGHTTRGVKFVKPWTWGGEQGIAIGAAPGGRHEVDDRNQDGVANDDDWIVEPTLNKKGDWNGDSLIDANDWDSMLYNARPANGRGVYVASAGEDGLFNCLRTQGVNKDNIENKLEDE